MEENSSVCVSIITPSFNQGEYLEETIQSVLNQSYSNIEYLLIDGGSKDNSVDIIKKYENRIDYWISEPDKGQADAINKGLKRANGDLVCWVNSDDILYPDYIAKRVQQFKENPNAGMIYGDIEKGPDPSIRRLRKGRQTSIKRMLKYAECPIPQQSAMWRHNVIEKIGYLVPSWHVVLDREYFIRIAANCSIKYVPGPVAFFRTHERTKSVAEKLKWAEELPKYYEMVFNENIYHLSPNLLSYKNRCLSKVYLRCARISAKAGKKRDAEDFFTQSKRSSFCNYILDRYL
ncbi:MAG: glycosyltransferase [Planctomycetota bacterium]|nr:MAG: glycosyltransferase [Planctomycetota bacterium]